MSLEKSAWATSSAALSTRSWSMDAWKILSMLADCSAVSFSSCLILSTCHHLKGWRESFHVSRGAGALEGLRSVPRLWPLAGTAAKAQQVNTIVNIRVRIAFLGRKGYAGN